MVHQEVCAEGRIRSIVRTLLRRDRLLPLLPEHQRRSKDHYDDSDGRQLEESALAPPARAT